MVYSIMEIRQLACKFHEYPKGLIHWKGEQLFRCDLFDSVICAWQFYSLEKNNCHFL